jgi:hypothetical protein
LLDDKARQIEKSFLLYTILVALDILKFVLLSQQGNISMYEYEVKSGDAVFHVKHGLGEVVEWNKPFAVIWFYKDTIKAHVDEFAVLLKPVPVPHEQVPNSPSTSMLKCNAGSNPMHTSTSSPPAVTGTDT